MIPIVGVGAVYLDTILAVPHYPDEDKKLRASKLTRRRGGNCANTLEVLEQLVHVRGRLQNSNPGPAPLYLLSVLPDRESSAVRTIRESLQHTRLEPTCIYRQGAENAASSYIITSEETGSRTIVSYNELQELTLEEFERQANLALSDAKAKGGWFHLEGRIPEVTLACLKHLRTDPQFKSSTFSIELEKPERTMLVEAAKEADVVFYSKIWAEHHGHTSARGFLETQLSNTRPNALLCCTWGSGGVTAVRKEDSASGEWASVEAWKPKHKSSRVVDAIGAGDTFIAGMIYALTHHQHDWSLKQKLSFANELAGRKVFQDGFAGLASKYCAAHNVVLMAPTEGTSKHYAEDFPSQR